jgi:hypothetical protein
LRIDLDTEDVRGWVSREQTSGELHCGHGRRTESEIDNERIGHPGETMTERGKQPAIDPA